MSRRATGLARVSEEMASSPSSSRRLAARAGYTTRRAATARPSGSAYSNRIRARHCGTACASQRTRRLWTVRFITLSTDGICAERFIRSTGSRDSGTPCVQIISCYRMASAGASSRLNGLVTGAGDEDRAQRWTGTVNSGFLKGFGAMLSGGAMWKKSSEWSRN